MIKKTPSLADAIRTILSEGGFAYVTADGQTIYAMRTADLASRLIEQGWRNVSNLDNYDVQKLVPEVKQVKAQYVGGAGRKARGCIVNVLA